VSLESSSISFSSLISPGENRDTSGAQDSVFRSQWRFNTKRGAILLMHRPRLIRVPDAFFKASLHIPVLKTKSVVYQVWNCPGFYMYLSNRCALFSGPLYSFVIEKQ
jgi:hypothetical protein